MPQSKRIDYGAKAMHRMCNHKFDNTLLSVHEALHERLQLQQQIRAISTQSIDAEVREKLDQIQHPCIQITKEAKVKAYIEDAKHIRTASALTDFD